MNASSHRFMPASALAFSANSKADHEHAQGRPTDLLLLHCNCGSGFSACIACDKELTLKGCLQSACRKSISKGQLEQTFTCLCILRLSIVFIFHSKRKKHCDSSCFLCPCIAVKFYILMSQCTLTLGDVPLPFLGTEEDVIVNGVPVSLSTGSS